MEIIQYLQTRRYIYSYNNKNGVILTAAWRSDIITDNTSAGTHEWSFYILHSGNTSSCLTILDYCTNPVSSVGVKHTLNDIKLEIIGVFSAIYLLIWHFACLNIWFLYLALHISFAICTNRCGSIVTHYLGKQGFFIGNLPFPIFTNQCKSLRKTPEFVPWPRFGASLRFGLSTTYGIGNCTYF